MKKSQTQNEPLLYKPTQQCASIQEQAEDFESCKQEMKEEFSFQIRCLCDHFEEQFDQYSKSMQNTNEQLRQSFLNIFHEKYDESQITLYQSVLKEEYEKKIQHYNDKLIEFKQKFINFHTMMEPLFDAYKKIQSSQSDEVIKLIFEYQDKVKDYLGDKKEQDDIIKYLSSQNKSLEDTVSSIIQQKKLEISKSKQFQDQMQSENIHLKKSIQSLEVEKINLMAQNQVYQKKNFNFQSELEKKKNLQKNANDLGNISACLKLELNGKEDLIIQLKNINEELQRSADEVEKRLTEKIGDQLREIELLKSQLKIEIQNRDNIVYEKDQEILSLEQKYQKDIAAIEDKRLHFQKNLMKNETDHLQLKNKYDNLREDLDNLQIKLQERERELQEEIDELMKKHENEIKLMSEQTFKQVMETKYEHEKKYGKIHEEYAQKMFHLKTQLNSLEKLLKHEEESHKQKCSEIIQMEQDHKRYVDELQNKISELNYQLYQQSVIITESSLSQSKSIKQIEYIQVENTECLAQIDSLKTEINELNETIKKQDEIIQKNIQNQLDTLNKRDADYNSKIQKILEGEKQKYYEKISEFVRQYEKQSDSIETQTEFNIDLFIQDKEMKYQEQLSSICSELERKFHEKEQVLSSEISDLQLCIDKLNQDIQNLSEDISNQASVHKKQLGDIKIKHKSELNEIKNEQKKDKNEKFLNQIKQLEAEKLQCQQELERLKELNQNHYDRLMKKIREESEKKIFELEQIVKNERHKSHLLKSEQILALQNLTNQYDQEKQILKIALKEAQEKAKKMVVNLRHDSTQTTSTLNSSQQLSKEIQTDFNYIQELYHKEKQKQMQDKMKKFEKECNDEKDKLIKDQETFLNQMLEEFKQLQKMFDDKYNDLNDRYKKLELDFEARPSRFEDIETIDKLDKRIASLQKQYKELTMDIQNREVNYNKVFKSNPIVGIYAPLMSNKSQIENLSAPQQYKQNKQSSQSFSFEHQNSISLDSDNLLRSTFQNKLIQSTLLKESEKNDEESLIQEDRNYQYQNSSIENNQFKDQTSLEFQGDEDSQIENKPNLINLPPKSQKKLTYSLNQPIVNLLIQKSSQSNNRYKKNSFDLNKSQDSISESIKIKQIGPNKIPSPISYQDEEGDEKTKIPKTSSRYSGQQLIGDYLDSDLPLQFSNELQTTQAQNTTEAANKKQPFMMCIKEDTQETEKTQYRRKNKLIVNGINMHKIENSQVQYVIESTRSMMNNVNNQNSNTNNQVNNAHKQSINKHKSNHSGHNHLPMSHHQTFEVNQSGIFGLPQNISNSVMTGLNRKIRSQNSNYSAINTNYQNSLIHNTLNSQTMLSNQSNSVNMNRCSTAMTGQYKGSNPSSSLDKSTLDIEIGYSKQMKRKYLNSSLDLPSTTSNQKYFDKLFSVSKSSNSNQYANLNSSTNASIISGQQYNTLEIGNKQLDNLQVNDHLSSITNKNNSASSDMKITFKQKQVPLNKLYKSIQND